MRGNGLARRGVQLSPHRESNEGLCDHLKTLVSAYDVDDADVGDDNNNMGLCRLFRFIPS